ncbi:hypothetical protein, partial [Arthrobacter bussei]|uniref:hypothetical protein n=1 Tax=Arthrobacter bussei TaxID=2594179 RepID=UPI0019D6065F
DLVPYFSDHLRCTRIVSGVEAVELRKVIIPWCPSGEFDGLRSYLWQVVEVELKGSSGAAEREPERDR